MAINLANVNLTIEQIVGESDPTFIVLGCSPSYKYVDGQKTDAVNGTKFDVIFPDGEFHRFNVTVEEASASITPEYLAERKASSVPIYAKLIGSKCKLYVDSSHKVQVSVKANKIEII